MTSSLTTEAGQRTNTPAPLLERVFAATPIGILVTTLEGSILDANPALQALLGLTLEQIREASDVGLSSVPGQPSVRAIVERLEAGSVASVQHERVLRGRSGPVHAEVTTTLLESSAGEPGAVLHTIVDVTRRHAAAESRYRSLFEQSPDGFVIATADRVGIVEANAAAAALFGCAPAALLGRRAFELAPPTQEDGRGSEVVFEEQVALAGRVGVARFGWRALAGKKRPLEIEVTVMPVHLEASPDLVLICLHDVTRQRALEDKLRQSQKLEAIGMLAGGIAHDFNNVLTGVNGFLELALERLPEDAGDPRLTGVRKCLGEARRAANRAVELTRHLLAFGRRSSANKNHFDLNESVHRTASLIRRLIGETIELALELSPAPCVLRGDAGELEQALLNLAINARDAMPAGGLLRIGSSLYTADAVEASAIDLPPGEYAVLEVSDSGLGMTDSVKVRIFEPFFTTKEVGRGTGLGLAVVHGVVQRHGGKIFVDSAPGDGTSVRIILPLVTGVAREAAQVAAKRPLERGTGSVLVVDDDPMVREVTAAMLETLGYRVRKASSAAEALLDVARELPDLVLTDVVMPDVSGIELERRLRRDFPGLPVLLVSGYAKDAFARHGASESAAAMLLPKPVTLETLGVKVKEMLSRAR